MATQFSGRTLVSGNDDPAVCPLIVSDVSLSFWGGIDPVTGIVIDTTHPLHGVCVADSILCLPSGRGSCTASQVLLELILNGKAPKALVLRDRDGLVCVGALIAKSVFPESRILDILQVEDFPSLLTGTYEYGCLLPDASLAVGSSAEEVSKMVDKSITKTTPVGGKEGALVYSSQEQDMLECATTDAERRAVECIIDYAHILSDNPSYIDVENAHIDGCTYIGPGGLKFVQRLLQDGGRVQIPTTLNSVSTDLRHWDRLGIIPTESQQASIELAETYLALGCSERSFTCAPYLLDNPPKLGQQIVWGESNAVVYANSVLGARTEKYADYLDICCAIVGKVPEVGVHLEGNRQARVLLDATHLDFVTDDPEAFSLLFPVLGHLCGTLSDGEVPILVGLERYSEKITADHMKGFCAAFGTTGTSPLIHVAGVTPEAKEPNDMINDCRRSVKITEEQLESTFETLDQGGTPEDIKVDWVALGNPHLSLSECEDLQTLVESLPEHQKKSENVQIVACMSRVLYDQSPAIPTLRDFGIEFVNDTCWCMLLEPPMIPFSPSAKILTNSGKYAHYGPGLTGRKFRLGTMSECIQAAVAGRLDRRPVSKFPWASQSRSFSYLHFHDRPKGYVMKSTARTNQNRSIVLKQSRAVLQALSKVAR
jgi:predicted aconitase/predicted aconitase with swiveling domain